MRYRNRIVLAAVILMAMHVQAGWLYSLQDGTAIWTEQMTGQQVVVSAGQAAPDGTPAPGAGLTDAIAAANAIADYNSRIRGGNQASYIALTSEQTAQNTAAANAASNTNTVTVIDRQLKGGSQTYTNWTSAYAYNDNQAQKNAELPTIKTEDMSAVNGLDTVSGLYTAPVAGGSSQGNVHLSSAGGPAITTGNAGTGSLVQGVYTAPATGTGTVNSGFYLTSGHYVSRSETPSGAAAANTANTASAVLTQSTAVKTSTASGNTVKTGLGVNYTGELPKTGVTNVTTGKTPS